MGEIAPCEDVPLLCVIFPRGWILCVFRPLRRWVCLLIDLYGLGKVDQPTVGYGTQAISTHSIKTLNVVEVLNKTLSSLSEKTESAFCLKQLVWDDVVTLEADAPTWHFLCCLYQVLLYLQRCLEHAAGVTEEDRVKNCILPSVARYVKKLLMGPDSEGACDHFNLLPENTTFEINRVEKM